MIPMADINSAECPRHIPGSHVSGSSHRSRCGLIAVAITWALIAVPCLRAQSSKPTDYDVKAVYLYNFGRFVEWPNHGTAAKNDTFTVCVLGQDPFGPALSTTFAAGTIDGKGVATKLVSNPTDAANCQILFISSSEDRRLKKIIESLDKNAVLKVSDMRQFSQHGGMIQFTVEGNKVRFEVNLTAARNVGLTLSSELLKVATKVTRNSSPGD